MDMPDDVLMNKVFPCLEPEDLHSLSCVNKFFKEAMKQLPLPRVIREKRVKKTIYTVEDSFGAEREQLTVYQTHVFRFVIALDDPEVACLHAELTLKRLAWKEIDNQVVPQDSAEDRDDGVRVTFNLWNRSMPPIDDLSTDHLVLSECSMGWNERQKGATFGLIYQYKCNQTGWLSEQEYNYLSSEYGNSRRAWEDFPNDELLEIKESVKLAAYSVRLIAQRLPRFENYDDSYYPNEYYLLQQAFVDQHFAEMHHDVVKFNASKKRQNFHLDESLAFVPAPSPDAWQELHDNIYDGCRDFMDQDERDAFLAAREQNLTTVRRITAVATGKKRQRSKE